MRKAIGSALPVAMAVLAVGCTNLEHPTAPQQSRLVVHSVVDTRFDKIIVLVARAQTGIVPAAEGIGDDEPVTDAMVTITAPNGTVMVAHHQVINDTFDEPGVYAVNPSDSGVILANAGTYSLHVQTETGEDVFGTTTIPQPPAWQQLGQRVFNRARDTLRLSWPRVAGARSYELVIAIDSQYVLYRTFADTSISLPGTAQSLAGHDVFPPYGAVQYMVEAVDVNYYEYYRMQSDPFAGVAPSHLTGAVGVFGSVVPILSGEVSVQNGR